MWSSGRRVLQDLFSQAAVRSLSLTPAQNTVVVERCWTVPLSKIGSPPRLNPRRHRIYKLVEDTKHAPQEKMELILTETVPKLGGRGDTVFVKKRLGRNKLLPQGLAVYPSPENKQMFAEELRLLREGKLDRKIQTDTALHTADFLKNSILKINKMPCEEFQLTKEVVSRQFLKKLRVVVPLHALTLPFEPIKELGDYWCEIVINRTTTVRVPMSLVPYEDPSASYQRQLKIQRQQEADADNLEAVDQDENKDEAVVMAVSEAIASQVSEASETAASEAQISQDTTAPPSDGPKKE